MNAFLLEVPGQVKTNEARTADDPDHSLIDASEAHSLSRQTLGS